MKQKNSVCVCVMRYNEFCPVLNHWAEDSHTCWSRPCSFLCCVLLGAHYSWASIWWRMAAGSFDVAIKISICVDSVRVLQLYGGRVPVGLCVGRKGLPWENSSACSFLLFLPRHLWLGAAGEGTLHLCTVRTWLSDFLEVHCYLEHHRTKNTVKNYVVA